MLFTNSTGEDAELSVGVWRPPPTTRVQPNRTATEPQGQVVSGG